MADTAHAGSSSGSLAADPRARGVKAYVERHRDELLAMLTRPDTAGLALARRHAKVMDGLLTTLYPAACASVSRPAGDDVVLAAVGGYGRSLLGWKSDLDVRLMTERGTAEQLQPLAEALLYPLWDAGVSIGHQVMTLSDALAGAEDDLPTATALLDLRPLAGSDAGAAELMRRRAQAQLFQPRGLRSFLQRLEAEVHDRHLRFGDPMYVLEPDLKSGEGGLRDLDVALWAGRARFGIGQLEQLMDHGVLLARETEALRAAADFLWAVRNHLHRRAGRRNDRLVFEEQERIAATLGYRARIGAAAGVPEHQLVGPMVEAFMHDYHRHTRAIARARELIVARAMPQASPARARATDLGQGVISLDGQIALADGALLERDPCIALRVYVAAVGRGSRVRGSTRDRIVRAAADPEFAAALRASPEAAALFVGLICTVRKTLFRNGSILTELLDTGLLVAMLPEFAPLVGRVQHDVYHVYPVDVHSVAAVDRLRALARGELIEAHPLACRIAAELGRAEVLFLSTLLHDLGKAQPGHGHALRGAELARSVFARLGFSAEETDRGCRLVRDHLAMYFVATRRDFSDAATLAEFAQVAQGRESLRELYLLTIADLSTTSPTSMNDWKARMLDELFRATDALFERGAALPGADADRTRIARIRAEVVQLCGAAIDPQFLAEFLDTMPDRYLLSNTPAEIVAHAHVAHSTRNSKVGVQLVPSRHPGVAELCVVTIDPPETTPGRDTGLYVVAGDRPGLLAAITAAITASRLEICAAQVHSRRAVDGSVQAVDLFWVRDRADGAAGVARALPKLERDLREVIAGTIAPRDLVSERPSRWSERPTPQVRTDVVIDNQTSAHHTIIEVLTKDRPGLLFTLAQALHEASLTIAIAKINTEGNRVIDVFYVTEIDGRKLGSEARVEQVRSKLLGLLLPG